MGIFSSIWDKITGHEAAKPVQPQTGAAPQPSAAPSPGASSPAPATAPVAQANVDVGAVLEAMASMKGDHGGNYKSSIVDLLKLLDLDSSLEARKKLAEELDIHAGEPGSAEQNIALHRAVVDKLAANGGIVPDSLRG